MKSRISKNKCMRKTAEKIILPTSMFGESHTQERDRRSRTDGRGGKKDDDDSGNCVQEGRENGGRSFRKCSKGKEGALVVFCKNVSFLLLLRRRRFRLPQQRKAESVEER